MYLDAQLGTMQVEGNEGWFMSSEKYVKAEIQNIEETLQKTGQRLPSKCKTPLAYRYRPELDITPELMTEFRQPLQVQSHLEMPVILVQLGHTQRT